MFGRDAEPAGRQWYIDQRLVPYRRQWTDSHGGDSAGATEFALSRIALDILNGALNEDAAIIANKVAVAQYFTEQVERWLVGQHCLNRQITVNCLQVRANLAIKL
jgi:hypothetical protein